MSYKTYPFASVFRLCTDVFMSYGYTRDESEFIADVITTSDAFGIESHGVNRLALYTYGIKIGRIKLDAPREIVRETPVSVAIDAHHGEGHLASRMAMEIAIEKAKKCGVGMATVRNSNHFGIAGYYSRMALEHGLMGICLTNAQALIVPTFGCQPMMGTDPIAVSMPAEPVPFNLDMATSVVPGGKIEVYAKNKKELLDGWLVDRTGRVTTDSQQFINIREDNSAGGILPVGGEGDQRGGHKGYGLAVLVELLTGNFSGGVNGDMVRKVKDEELCCHFFAAIDYGMFGEKAEIEKSFSDYLQRIRDSQKAVGYDRIYTHGEKEEANAKRVRSQGIRINGPTLDEIRELCAERNIDYKKYLVEI